VRPLLELSALVVVAIFAITVGIGVVFCVVTWMWMRRVAPRRTRKSSIRAFLREMFLILITQPLLPFFYFFGRGRATKVKGAIPIILVHGYFQNRIDFLYMARVLRKKGRVNVFAFNYPWWSSIQKNAERLGRFVAWVREHADAARVDLVGHSMGGLVVLDYVTHLGGAEHVRRCVTIATPHQGVLYKGPMLGWAGSDLRAESKYLTSRATQKIPVPTLSIASQHDNVVYPATRASLAARGGRDEVVADHAHLAILFDPKVIDLTAAFLNDASPEVIAARAERAGVATEVGVTAGAAPVDALPAAPPVAQE
jgi:pimeloyl-ACP methyl ester carboxylesterase